MSVWKDLDIKYVFYTKTQSCMNAYSHATPVYTVAHTKREIQKRVSVPTHICNPPHAHSYSRASLYQTYIQVCRRICLLPIHLNDWMKGFFSRSSTFGFLKRKENQFNSLMCIICWAWEALHQSLLSHMQVNVGGGCKYPSLWGGDHNMQSRYTDQNTASLLYLHVQTAKKENLRTIYIW